MKTANKTEAEGRGKRSLSGRRRAERMGSHEYDKGTLATVPTRMRTHTPGFPGASTTQVFPMEADGF